MGCGLVWTVQWNEQRRIETHEIDRIHAAAATFATFEWGDMV